MGNYTSSVQDAGRVTSLALPPEKSQNKGKAKTSGKFNNRGYCKQKTECENKHSYKVCDDLDCNEDQCEKRHPNPCKFGPW